MIGLNSEVQSDLVLSDVIYRMCVTCELYYSFSIVVFYHMAAGYI